MARPVEQLAGNPANARKGKGVVDVAVDYA